MNKGSEFHANLMRPQLSFVKLAPQGDKPNHKLKLFNQNLETKWRFAGFKENSPTVQKVRAMEGFIGRNHELVKTSEIKKRRAFPLDLKLLMSDQIFMEAWPDFATELIDSPDQTLNILGLAMHQVFLSNK